MGPGTARADGSRCPSQEILVPLEATQIPNMHRVFTPQARQLRPLSAAQALVQRTSLSMRSTSTSSTLAPSCFPGNGSPGSPSETASRETGSAYHVSSKPENSRADNG